MESVGVRELRQHASRVLARVKNGETVEVTERGRPVARLVPIAGSPWAELVAAGLVTLPTEPGSLLDLEPIEGEESLSATLMAQREHER
jgi:prevent-host-death family protein